MRLYQGARQAGNFLKTMEKSGHGQKVHSQAAI